jgi:very-short-patch-repair endonuclease
VGGAKFRRQQSIGRYVVDFCCPERRLVVEVDGGQHLAEEESDLQRTAFLLRRGYRMLRFWDNDVLLNADVVMEEIARAVEDPHPNPLPRRERAKNSVSPW